MPTPHHVWTRLVNLDTTAVYAVAGHGLKTRLKAALDFGAESPRPREFQSSGKHALARYGPHTGETFLWLLYWRAMYTHNVRALLTSLQAANHVFWYSHPLTVIHWRRLSLLAWLRARCWCLNQGFARATRRLRQRADLRNGLHAPRPRAAQREASALKRRMACASCAVSSGVANNSRRRSVVSPSPELASKRRSQPAVPTDRGGITRTLDCDWPWGGAPRP